jgi:hypothetical protein
MQKILLIALFCLTATWSMAQSKPAFPNLSVQRDASERIDKAEVLKSGVGVYLITSNTNLLNWFSGKEKSSIIAVREGQEIWRYQLPVKGIIGANYSQIFATQDSGLLFVYRDFSPCNPTSTLDEYKIIKIDKNGIEKSLVTYSANELTANGNKFIYEWLITNDEQGLDFLTYNFEGGIGVYEVNAFIHSTIDTLFNDESIYSGFYAFNLLRQHGEDDVLWAKTQSKVYKIKDGIITDSIQNFFQYIFTTIAISPDGRYLTVCVDEGPEAGYIELYDIGNDDIELIRRTNSDWAPASTRKLGFMPDGTFAAWLKYPYTIDDKQAVAVWASMDSLDKAPERVTTFLVPWYNGDFVVNAPFITFVSTEAHFDFRFAPQLGATGAIRNFDWHTGDPVGDYMDVEMLEVRAAPNTWGHQLPDDSTAFNVSCSGLDVTVLNKSNKPLQNVTVNVYIPDNAQFDGCPTENTLVQRFDGLNLAPQQRITLRTQGFEAKGLQEIPFTDPTKNKSIYVWLAAPNDLPDSNVLNDGFQLIDFFSLRPIPGTFRVYPNPVNTDILFVTVEKADFYQVNFTIYNTLGQTIFDGPIINNNEFYEIPVHGLLPGMYYLEVGDRLVPFVRL